MRTCFHIFTIFDIDFKMGNREIAELENRNCSFTRFTRFSYLLSSSFFKSSSQLLLPLYIALCNSSILFEVQTCNIIIVYIYLQHDDEDLN